MKQPKKFAPETRIVESTRQDGSVFYTPQFKAKDCFFWWGWYDVNTRKKETVNAFKPGMNYDGFNYQFWRDNAFGYCDQIETIEEAEFRLSLFIEYVNEKRQHPYKKTVVSDRVVK